MTNDECGMTKEFRMSNEQFDHRRSFVIGHSFVITHSSFVIPK